MNDIQNMKNRRADLIIEIENIQREMTPLEAELENPELLERDRKQELQNEVGDRTRRINSLNHEINALDQKIDRRETLANHESLATDYMSAMASWKSDELELYEKRDSIKTRLRQICQQDREDMAKAQQAEIQAASAYAQAVAWGDVDGEKNANADAQKAAKNLASAAEHHRRQQLIISALERELVTIDEHIVEAQNEYAKWQKKAAHLANIVLEEKWSTVAKTLLETGSKLYAARDLINQDPVALMKLYIPKQGEEDGSWTWKDLSDRAYQHSLADLLAA